MPIEEFQRGSGIRVHAGEAGTVYENVGRLVFRKAAIKGIDQNLFAAFKIVADQHGLVIVSSSIDTGKHTTGSRHYLGCAADIVEVYPVGGTPLPATLANPHCIVMVEAFHAAGWRWGEGGPWGGVLIGPAMSERNRSKINHLDHCHVSVARP